MSQDILGTFLWVAFLLGAWVLAQRYWRGQAINCAHQWAVQRHLSVADWSKATFQMHRQGPSITFVASNNGVRCVDVKLRFRMTVFDGWHVDEVAYCLPRDVCEDDALAL
jgi:hypothetical protein